jgi:hypothetical protein
VEPRSVPIRPDVAVACENTHSKKERRREGMQISLPLAKNLLLLLGASGTSQQHRKSNTPAFSHTMKTESSSVLLFHIIYIYF